MNFQRRQGKEDTGTLQYAWIIKTREGPAGTSLPLDMASATQKKAQALGRANQTRLPFLQHTCRTALQPGGQRQTSRPSGPVEFLYPKRCATESFSFLQFPSITKRTRILIKRQAHGRRSRPGRERRFNGIHHTKLSPWSKTFRSFLGGQEGRKETRYNSPPIQGARTKSQVRIIRRRGQKTGYALVIMVLLEKKCYQWRRDPIHILLNALL